MVRPLIHQLKHCCGGNDVVNRIQINGIRLRVVSTYKPNMKIDGVNKFVRSFNVISFNPVTKKNVEKMIDWSKGTKQWISDIKKMGSSVETIAPLCPKISLFKKIFSFPKINNQQTTNVPQFNLAT